MFTVKCQEWLIDFVDISSSFIIFKFLLEVKTWLRFFNTKLAGFLWIFFQDRGFGFIECKETQEIYGHLVDGGIQRSFFKPFSKILGPKAGWVLAENSPKNSRSMAQRKTQLFSQVFWTRGKDIFLLRSGLNGLEIATGDRASWRISSYHLLNIYVYNRLSWCKYCWWKEAQTTTWDVFSTL